MSELWQGDTAYSIDQIRVSSQGETLEWMRLRLRLWWMTGAITMKEVHPTKTCFISRRNENEYHTLRGIYFYAHHI